MKQLLTLYLLLLCAFGARAEAIFSGKPPAGFFSTPDTAEVTDSSTTLSATFDDHVPRKDFYLIAVPPTGELTFEITAATVRNAVSDETKSVLSDFDEMTRMRLMSELRARVQLAPFGVFRNVRTARIAVDRTKPTILRAQESWELCGYTIRINYPAFKGPAAKGRDKGLYRNLLTNIITVPQAIDAFASDQFSRKSTMHDSALIPRKGWWRIPIAKDGIYLIDGKYLADSKFDVENVTPNDLRIVRSGKPVETSALDDGSLPFAQGGRLIFYATGNESLETAEASYFLRIATPSEAPAFMKVVAPRSEAPSLRRTFIRTYVNEKDELFQTRMGAFLSVQKMLWTWAEIKPGEGAQIDFDVPGFSQVDATENTSATLNLYSRGDGVSPPANYRILVNDEEITTRTITSTATPIPLDIPSKLLRETANKLTIKTDAPADPKAPAVFIDSLSLTYTSIFAGKNGALALELPKDDAAADSRLQVTGLRGQHVVALKISGDSLERLNVQASRGTALVDAHTKAGDRLIFMEESQIPRPAPAQPTEAEPLSRDGDADILVIYHNVHQEAATLLAKNLNDAGMHAIAIDVQRIFDAYNYGDLSTNAIRDFLADAVHSWSGRRPDAVILIGDACGDGRNVSRQDVPNQIPIHSLASRGGSPGNRISSDSYYSWLNDGDQATDLIVSRISASLPQESLNAVKNIIRYRSEQETPSDWKQRIMLIADTGGFSTAVNNLAQEYASDFSEEKVLLVDDLPWEDNYYLPPTMISRSEDSKVSPAMTTAIDAVYAAGCGASLFFGHGAPNLWSNQRFWFGGGTPNSDILRMNVTHKLPFVASFTCNNAVIDYPLRPWNVCIAEDFMRYEGKGAIGCFMPSGPGYVTNHEMLADGFLRGWALGVREHGVLCEMSRINHQVRLEVDDHTRMFIELGDPTLKLAALSKTEPQSSSGENSLIQRVVTIDEPTSATLSGQWSIALVNRSSSPELARLKIRTLDEQGTTLQEEEREVPMDPGAEKPVRFAARFPAVGVYRIRAELESASGRFQLSQLPSRIAEQRVIIPPATGALKIADDSVQLRAGNSVVPKPSLVYTIVNLAGQALSADIKATGTIDGTEVFSINRKSDRVEPGKQLALNDAVALPTLIEKPVTINIVWTEITADKREIGSGSFSKTFSSGDFSDLRIVPGSVTLDPAQPFDGGTVFVRGEVENIGAALSPPTTISMFKASDEARSKPLRDFTTATGREVAPLKPGEKRPFTLRWDPSDDAGDQKLVITIDPKAANLEPNRENNSAPLEFRVRTKTKLASGKLVIENTSDTTKVRLLAQVSNLGEVDSRPVAVTFYKSQLQTDDTKLDEVVVPSIPAGTTMEVPLEVPLASFSIDPSKFQPSFTIALKGSLMRVSSVTPP